MVLVDRAFSFRLTIGISNVLLILVALGSFRLLAAEWSAQVCAGRASLSPHVLVVPVAAADVGFGHVAAGSAGFDATDVLVVKRFSCRVKGRCTAALLLILQIVALLLLCLLLNRTLWVLVLRACQMNPSAVLISPKTGEDIMFRIHTDIFVLLFSAGCLAGLL